MTTDHSTEAAIPPSTAGHKRPLTWRYSLIVVASALAAVVAVRWVVAVLGDSLRRQAEQESPGTWAGVGVALVMLAITQLATLLILLVGVPIAIGRRRGSRPFVLAFVASVLLLTLVLIGAFGFAALGFPFTLDAVALGFGFLVLPLLWVVPAFAASLVPGRVVLVVLASGLAASVIAWGLTQLRADAEQAGYNAAYHGPVVVPAGDPDELLAGYDLGVVELPNEYSSPSTPALRLTFDSESGAGAFFVDVYEGHEHDLCGFGCRTVGEAPGGTVTTDEAAPTFVSLTLDDGTVEISGLSEEQAMTVFHGLRHASIAEFAALR
jgi:hypothetical protein